MCELAATRLPTSGVDEVDTTEGDTCAARGTLRLLANTERRAFRRPKRRYSRKLRSLA